MESVLSGSELDCVVCYHRYHGLVRRPRQLLCGHTFCSLCLKLLLGAREETGSTGSTEGSPLYGVTCPLCRRVTPVPDTSVRHLPENQRILELLSCQSPPGGDPAPAFPFLPEGLPEILLSPSLLLHSYNGTLLSISQPQPTAELVRLPGAGSGVWVGISSHALRHFLVVAVLCATALSVLTQFVRNTSLFYIIAVVSALCLVTVTVLLCNCWQRRRSERERGGSDSHQYPS
ncbi:UNVERIFIED_CONTAM: hypothetical protein FKN15_013079 [Acipenser sinensis]